MRENIHSKLAEGAHEFYAALAEKRPRVNPHAVGSDDFREFQRGLWEAADAKGITDREITVRIHRRGKQDKTGKKRIRKR